MILPIGQFQLQKAAGMQGLHGTDQAKEGVQMAAQVDRYPTKEVLRETRIRGRHEL